MSMMQLCSAKQHSYSFNTIAETINNKMELSIKVLHTVGENVLHTLMVIISCLETRHSPAESSHSIQDWVKWV